MKKQFITLAMLLFCSVFATAQFELGYVHYLYGMPDTPKKIANAFYHDSAYDKDTITNQILEEYSCHLPFFRQGEKNADGTQPAPPIKFGKANMANIVGYAYKIECKNVRGRISILDSNGVVAYIDTNDKMVVIDSLAAIKTLFDLLQKQQKNQQNKYAEYEAAKEILSLVTTEGYVLNANRESFNNAVAKYRKLTDQKGYVAPAEQRFEINRDPADTKSIKWKRNKKGKVLGFYIKFDGVETTEGGFIKPNRK